jgi:hypothetical protein
VSFLNASGGQAGSSVTVIGLSKNAPTITNVTLGVAGTETAIALPADTVEYKVRARGTSRLQVSYTAGQSDTTYWTVPMGGCYFEERLAAGSRTLYLQATKDNEVIEIVSWT